ncbi:helix-turn-helix domain-containing protein [Novacetimonas hansenii]|uniref:helix-turn-helix domain-containing protein n=1 Tax=Novacetimonas hansenii TaxID=436 RepID=UPI00094FD854|nr:helix-turn-helix domain-containing protein [Novacetimonas hansenii]PYD74020.1 helix-turn-helix domain-containing protein [Novacetimonas hansenii]
MSEGTRMFRQKNTNTGDAATPPTGGDLPHSVGQELRARREQLGWSLPDVASWLRIRLPYLEALEEGRAQALPGSAYAIGFLRTYSKALGLAPEPLIQRFKMETRGSFDRKPDLSFPVPLPEKSLPLGVILLGGIVILVGAYIGWYRMTGASEHPVITTHTDLPGISTPGTASPQIASVLPAPGELPPNPPQPLPQQEQNSITALAPSGPPEDTSPAKAPSGPVEKMGEDKNALANTHPDADHPAGTDPAAPAATTATDQITLNASAPTWVQVRQQGGGVIYDHTLGSGEAWQVPVDKHDLVLTVGNAGGLTLSANGVVSPPLGRNGEVRRNIILSAQAISSGTITQAPPTTSRAPMPPPAARPTGTISAPMPPLPPVGPSDGGNNTLPPLPQTDKAE